MMQTIIETYGIEIDYSPMKLCACGCGKLAEPGNRFIRGHNLTIELSSKAGLKGIQSRMKDKDKFYKDCVKGGMKGGKRCYELHREEIIERIKKYHRENKGFYSKQLKETREKHPDIFKEAPSKGGKQMHKDWKERDPEGYKKHQTKASKIANEMMNNDPKYFKIRSEKAKKFHRENPDFFKEIMRKTQNDWKERDPIGYREHHVKIGKIVHAKHPNLLRENTLKAHKAIRENKPYVWKGVHFMSNEEMEVAKKLLADPTVNVNCHITINGKIIDFFPQENDLQYQGCFVEYHPADWLGRTEEEYYNARKGIIENSQYKGTTLIVLTDMEDI